MTVAVSIQEAKKLLFSRKIYMIQAITETEKRREIKKNGGLRKTITKRHIVRCLKQRFHSETLD